jgi:VanZ family protein
MVNKDFWNASPFLWGFRVVLALAMMVVLYLALSPQQAVSLGSDKVNHVLAFVALGTFAQFGFPRLNPLWVLVPLFCFGVAIELLQTQVGRFAAMDDLVADGIGLIISVAVSWGAHRVFTRR